MGEPNIVNSSSERLTEDLEDRLAQDEPAVSLGDVDQSPSPPRTGVEIVESEDRNGTIYHTVRDLRNDNLIKNVTRTSARKLWHYAITQIEAGRPVPEEIDWKGNMAIVHQRRRNNHVWYDLAMKDSEGIRVYFGVTDSGLNEDWMNLVEQNG